MCSLLIIIIVYIMYINRTLFQTIVSEVVCEDITFIIVEGISMHTFLKHFAFPKYGRPV